MNLEDLKDQITEKGQEYWSQIEESSLYISLKEKYDGLPIHWQKIVFFLGIFFVFYIIYSIPASFVASSEDYEEYFEDNRQLTRDLIRAGRLAQTLRTPPPAPSFASLQSQIQASLARNRVLDSQRRNIIEIKDVADKKLVPKGIDQMGVKLGAQQLNLKQVVDVAEDLSRLNSSQLINFSMQADAQDPHFFNVDYELASFSVPYEPEPVDKKKKSKKR